jgi:predicted nucleic acid-binding protein
MELPKPFLTCEAVVTEACYLVRRSKGGETAVLDFVANDILKIDFSISDEIEKVISLMKKYADIPMSFADACLLRMCELGQDVELFTLDSDFGIYRMHGRYQVPVVTG